ncbi:MAG: bifunctional DNA-formamidopyrimidine glycosylase/DNA-(apurinic or apyrimidinic site) lyase [Propionibacteriaceae bacterium]|jgi:formamidopyrimidine-DNA glycosylase|nr:bifunctional DNA-formamidopyrimidine glycosylase/DNA-(apurinic or apyrimidinic site) lyase [Propionibacteriaceae bacterium]
MPELPEVETVRAGLAPHISGRTVTHVEVLHPRAVRRHQGDFAEALRGRTLGEPQRRGKFLYIPLEAASALFLHLGMSGQVRVGDAGHQHDRVVFTLDDTVRVRFVDQRTFGAVWIADDWQTELGHIALDLFDPRLDLDALATQIASSGREIKRVLLDQGVVSGIGNIYADESLWRAQAHYRATGVKLGKKRVKALLEAAKEVMAESLAAGGTSFDSLYVNAHGEPGYFTRSLAVYGREGQPCPRCATAIKREPYLGRSSYLCPRCQRKPR